MNYLTHEQLDALKEYVRACAYHVGAHDGASARSESYNAMARAEHMLDIALLPPPQSAAPTLREVVWSPEDRIEFVKAGGPVPEVLDSQAPHCRNHPAREFGCLDCLNATLAAGERP